ncbi:MAG: metallophosphoesterase [Halanaerobiaceae bacterium]|nr:metallophosphoesterase [Halanaerobiaceae bacterium]
MDPLYELDEIREKGQVTLLHISDTPDAIYPFIFSVIDRLKPDYIIHTGDIVDNIKLAAGGSILAYQRSLQKFIKELKKRDWAEKYIIPGNHDSIDCLREYVGGDIKLKEEGDIINIGGTDIGLAHYLEDLPDNTLMSLYGHDNSLKDSDNKLFLNGLLNLNIILLPSREIFKISYPGETDFNRGYRRLKLP